MKKCCPISLEDAVLHALFMSKSFDTNAVTLYHYTKSKTLGYIVKGDAFDFRFSEVSSFLDKNEGRSIIEPFLHACGKLYDSDKIDKRFFDICSEIADSKNGEKCFTPPGYTWVLCFSENGNSAFMKERYSSKDGRIIAVNNIICADEEYEGLQIVKVSYSFAEMRKVFERKIILLYQGYQNDLKGRKEEISEEKIEVVVRNGIRSLLSSYCYCYKGMSYRKEEEVRYICQVPESEMVKDGTVWESGDKTERLLFISGELHLILNREKYMVGIYDRPLWENDTMLNKSILTGEEIRRIKVSRARK